MDEGASDHEDEVAGAISPETRRGGASAAADTPQDKYPAGSATQSQVVNDHELFWKTLGELHDCLGFQLRIPVVAGSELDLHLLYKQVSAAGGLQTVVSRKQWPEICKPFNFPPTFTSRSWTMRRLYCQLLWHYEQVYLHRNRGPVMDPPFIDPMPRTGSGGRGSGRGRSKGRVARSEGEAAQPSKRRRLGVEGEAPSNAVSDRQQPQQERHRPHQPEPRQPDPSPSQHLRAQRPPAIVTPYGLAPFAPARMDAAVVGGVGPVAAGPGLLQALVPAEAAQEAAADPVRVQALVPGPHGMRRVLAVRIGPSDQTALAAAAMGAPLVVMQPAHESPAGGTPPLVGTAAQQEPAARGCPAQQLPALPSAAGAAACAIPPAAVRRNAVQLAPVPTARGEAGAALQEAQPLAFGEGCPDEPGSFEGFGTQYEGADGGPPPGPQDADERSSGTMSGSLRLRRGAAEVQPPPRAAAPSPPPALLVPVPPAPLPPPPRRTRPDRLLQTQAVPAQRPPQHRARRPPTALPQPQEQARPQPPDQPGKRAEPHQPALVAMGGAVSPVGAAAERPSPGTSFTGTVESVFDHGVFVTINLCGQQYRGVLYNPPPTAAHPAAAQAPPETVAQPFDSIPAATAGDEFGCSPPSVEAQPPRRPLHMHHGVAPEGANCDPIPNGEGEPPDEGPSDLGVHAGEPFAVVGRRLQLPGAALPPLPSASTGQRGAAVAGASGPAAWPDLVEAHQPAADGMTRAQALFHTGQVEDAPLRRGGMTAAAPSAATAVPGNAAEGQQQHAWVQGVGTGLLGAGAVSGGMFGQYFTATAAGPSASGLPATDGEAAAGRWLQRRVPRRAVSPRRAPVPSPSARSAVSGGCGRRPKAAAGHGAAGGAHCPSAQQAQQQQPERAPPSTFHALTAGGAAQGVGAHDNEVAGSADQPVEHVGETEGGADVAADCGAVGCVGGTGTASQLQHCARGDEAALHANGAPAATVPLAVNAQSLQQRRALLQPAAAADARLLRSQQREPRHWQPQQQQQMPSAPPTQAQAQAAAPPHPPAPPPCHHGTQALPSGAPPPCQAALPLPCAAPRAFQLPPPPHQLAHRSPASPEEAAEGQGLQPGPPAWSPDASVCNAPLPQPHWPGPPSSQGAEPSPQQLQEHERHRTCESVAYGHEGRWGAEQEPLLHAGAWVHAGSGARGYQESSHGAGAAMYLPARGDVYMPAGALPPGLALTGGEGCTAHTAGHGSLGGEQARFTHDPQGGLGLGTVAPPQLQLQQAQAYPRQHPCGAQPQTCGTDQHAALDTLHGLEQLHGAPPQAHLSSGLAAQLPGSTVDLNTAAEIPFASGYSSCGLAAAAGGAGGNGCSAAGYYAAPSLNVAAAGGDGSCGGGGAVYVQDSVAAEAALSGTVYCYVEQDGQIVQQALDIHPDMLQHLHQLAAAQGGPVAVELELPLPLPPVLAEGGGIGGGV